MTIFSKADEDKEKQRSITAASRGITETGVCDTCHKRYINSPVIDGRAQCPYCDKP